MPPSDRLPSAATCCTASSTPADWGPDEPCRPERACCADVSPSRQLRDRITDPFVQLALLR